MMKLPLVLGLIGLYPFIGVAAEEFYVVKPGEIFSRIARKHFGAPTYSDVGAIEKLKSLNPEIKNIQQLTPGQKLRISSDASQSQASQESIVPNDSSLKAPLIVIKEAKGEFAPNLKFVTLKTVERSSNTHTDIVSKYYVDLPLRFEQKYHPKMSLYQRLTLANVLFSGLQGDSSRDQKFFLWGAALGMKYFDVSRFDFFAELGFDPMLYAKDVTRSGFKMVAINLPNFKLGAQRGLINIQNFTVGARAHAASYFSGSDPSFTVNTGFGFGGGLFLRQTYSTSSWGVDLGADKIYQDTSLFKQTRTDLMGMFKYELLFF